MRFMTYNIRLGRQRGRGRIVEIVESARPDVLALQEVGSNWREGPPGETAAAIGMKTGLEHVYFVPTICEGLGTSRYGHALLSRWPIRDATISPLPQLVDEPRRLLLARIVAPRRRVDVAATHLSHKGRDREVQGPELVERLQRTNSADGVPRVVMGDLNEAESGRAPWLKQLRDAFDPACRYDGRPTFPNPDPTQRIDDLLVRGTTWTRASVLDRPKASDHRPVVAEM